MPGGMALPNAAVREGALAALKDTNGVLLEVSDWRTMKRPGEEEGHTPVFENAILLAPVASPLSSSRMPIPSAIPNDRRDRTE